MNSKIKVVLIQRIFATYRKAIYNSLINSIDFKVLHAKGNNGISETNTPYSIYVPQLKYSKRETNTFLFVFNHLLTLKPDVIIHEFAIGILSLPITFLFARIIGSKFILWSHGYDRKLGFYPNSNFLDKYRLFLMKKADAILLYSQMDKVYLSKFISASKIFIAQNTIDTSKYLKIKSNLIKEGRVNVKARLNFNHKYNIIFIGRLLKDKNPLILIDIYEILSKIGKLDLAIHFVGDGELFDELKDKIYLKGFQKDIFLHGSIHDENKTGELLFCSDIMVMPGYLGLSVNHSLCFECPVISFEQNKYGPFHSPEVEYVINGKTGFLIKDHTSAAIAEKIYEYLNDISLQAYMKSSINEMVDKVFSMRIMEKGILDSIYYVYR